MELTCIPEEKKVNEQSFWNEDVNKVKFLFIFFVYKIMVDVYSGEKKVNEQSFWNEDVKKVKICLFFYIKLW